MSYKTKQLQAFLANVKAELEQVIGKHQKEYERLVFNEIPKGEYLCSGMGSVHRCSLKKDDAYFDDKIPFMQTINDATWGDMLHVNLDLPYKASKERVVTPEIEKLLENYEKESKLKFRDSIQYKMALEFLNTGRIEKLNYPPQKATT